MYFCTFSLKHLSFSSMWEAAFLGLSLAVWHSDFYWIYLIQFTCLKRKKKKVINHTPFFRHYINNTLSRTCYWDKQSIKVKEDVQCIMLWAVAVSKTQMCDMMHGGRRHCHVLSSIFWRNPLLHAQIRTIARSLHYMQAFLLEIWYAFVNCLLARIKSWLHWCMLMLMCACYSQKRVSENWKWVTSIHNSMLCSERFSFSLHHVVLCCAIFIVSQCHFDGCWCF